MKPKVYTNFFWRFFERCGAQAVTLIVSIVLARILDPSIYGVVSLISVFIAILQVFIDCGLGTALIQKKDSDQIDFSTVFYSNIVLCSLLYSVLFFCSPLIASFYQSESLVAIIRVMGLSLIISAFKNIEQAYVTKHLIFRKFFFATLVGTIIAAIVGILMAVRGYGVWALVVQNLVNQTVDTIILFLIIKWKPSFHFSFKRLKKLFGFSWKLLVTGLIDVIYQKIRQLVIGKGYSKDDLAFYNEGQQIPYTIISNVNTSIDSILFPVLSREQEDVNRVKELTRKAIRISTFVITPMLIGLAAVSESLVHFVLTEKWMPCVFFLILSCLMFIFAPINTAILNSFKALGKSRVVLMLEIIKKSFGILLLIITFNMGVKAIAIGFLISYIFASLINLFPAQKILNYSFFEQCSDFVPNFLISIFMGICVYRFNFLGLLDWVALSIQIPFGILIFLILVFVTKNKNFDEIIRVVKELFGKSKKGDIHEN